MKRTIIMALAVLLSATASFAQTTTAKKHKHHHHASSAMQYTCSMHPEVMSNKPGNCPKCGMALVPVKKKSTKTVKAKDDMKM